MSAAFEQALYYKLANTTGITNLVSTRIYPVGEAPSNATYPLIVWQRVGAVHQRHMVAANGLAHERYQFDAYGETALVVQQIADAMRAALEMYTGNMGESGSTVNVSRVFLENDAASYEPPESGGDKGYWRVRMDYTFWHTE